VKNGLKNIQTAGYNDDLTWLYGPIAAGAALVLTITLFKVPLELMIFDDFEIC
jgi:hypothetical protein